MPIVRKFRDIESTGKIKKGIKERYISIAETMLKHKKFMSLKSSSKTLYIYMKYWACGRIEFEYAISMSKSFMSANTFLKSKDELVDKGFIEVIEIGKFTRTTNKYKFSNKWYKQD